jgi:HSP20 family protein
MRLSENAPNFKRKETVMALIRWQKPETARWDPFRQLSTLRSEIDRLFDEPFSALGEGMQPFMSGWSPALDLYEDRDNLTVKAELPGMKKEDIEISLHDGVLTLSGERKDEQNRHEGDIHRSERFVGKFQRTLTLPTPVEADKVKASYKDGILTVTLPKAETAKPKQIQIKTD